MTLNPIPGAILHNMIVEGLSMPAAPQRKAQADPCAKGLAGKSVAISEAVASVIIGGEFSFGSRNPLQA
jgi:hypothetical protein